MHGADFYNDLCAWEFLWASPEAMATAQERDDALHEREAKLSVIIDATLRRAARIGFAGLSQRERDLILAYNAGANIQV